MQHAAGRRLLLGMIALGGLVLVLVSASALALGENRGAAWCYDGNRWLAYAEGIPGSATPEELTTCLRDSAARGDVMAFDGQLVEGGALIDVGDSSLFWTLPHGFSIRLKITAYRDHFIIEDSCDRAFEVRDGTSLMIEPGFPCREDERIREDDRMSSDPDFTLFVTRGQFILAGAEGWYHIVRRPRGGWRPGPAPLGQIEFKGIDGAVWVTAEVDDLGSYIYDIHQPVANTAHDAQQYRQYDWEQRVGDQLIPVSFDQAASFLSVEDGSYWDEVRGWLDAIMEDLFHGRAEPVGLVVLDDLGWVAYADVAARTINTSYSGGPRMVLHELAHILVGDQDAHGGRFVATMLMLWERYIPGFDVTRARELTHRYAVEIGRPVTVEPVSYRTRIVHDLFGKTEPVLPSDHTPIETDEMLPSVVLELGRTYRYGSDGIIATSTSTRLPNCNVMEQSADGSTISSRYPPQVRFTIGPGSTWNGLTVGGFSNETESVVRVSGTPTVAGRVRVKVTTQCPGGYTQEPRLVGYAEVIVRDPQSSN